ncbi:MAG: histidinol-phosphate transaminase [Tissierellia bacterium]|nr:histidinol-phosphate transaminase [Tissierellia bacterium]
MDKFKHGADILSYEKYFDGDLIDFSSNINPIGPPKGIENYIFDRLKRLQSYPDAQYRNLKSKLSNYLKADEKNICVGNGAMEIIDMAISRFKRALIFVPAFIEYELRAKFWNLDIEFSNLDHNFEIDFENLKKILKSETLVILGNPQNPSGNIISKEKLLNLYEIIKSKNAYLLLDEAFFEFANLDYDTIELFKKYKFENIGIVRAATKFFALPGVRLGYGVFDEEMAKAITNSQLPWTVNSVAEICAEYIFKDLGYIKESTQNMDYLRAKLFERLKKIKGLRPIKSHSNYILIECEKSEDYYFYELLKRGFIIRRCSNYRNLNGNYIRIAVKNENLNDELIKALEEICI